GRDQPTGDSSRRGLQNREDTATSEFIFSGELLESISEDKRYLPEYNQQIAPYNRYAIEIYLNIEAMLGVSDPRGRLLDQFV
ncbi:MAG: hypothetical protein GY784_14210, partial [Gammaproteobacteria bacterium]|nr:hypothetical protein [Gammaproteobacteria bacterium]